VKEDYYQLDAIIQHDLPKMFFFISFFTLRSQIVLGFGLTKGLKRFAAGTCQNASFYKMFQSLILLANISDFPTGLCRNGAKVSHLGTCPTNSPVNTYYNHSIPKRSLSKGIMKLYLESRTLFHTQCSRSICMQTSLLSTN